MDSPYNVLVPLDQHTVGVLSSLANDFSEGEERWSIEDVIRMLLDEFFESTPEPGMSWGECGTCGPDGPDDKPPTIN